MEFCQPQCQVRVARGLPLCSLRSKGAGVRTQELQELQELQEYRSTGVQEYRSTGVQEYRSTGVQEYRSTGVQEYRSTGVQWRLKISRLKSTLRDSCTPELLTPSPNNISRRRHIWR